MILTSSLLFATVTMQCAEQPFIDIDAEEVLGLKKRSDAEERAIERYLQNTQWLSPVEARYGQQHPDELRKSIVRQEILMGWLVVVHPKENLQKNYTDPSASADHAPKKGFQYMAADSDMHIPYKPERK